MTIRIVGQVSLVEATSAGEKQEFVRALCESGMSIEGAISSHAGVHTESSVGGGDLTWDLRFSEEDAVEDFCERVKRAGEDGIFGALGAELGLLAPRVSSIELAIPEAITGHVGVPGLVGIKRTLWLRVLPGTDPAASERFEAETPMLAAAVPAIRNWQWSRIRVAAPNPMTTRWTHLWEQEFETLAGLESDYMASPCHWGFVDRWFDPEMPDRIVDLWLAHLACPATESVLGWQAAG